MKFFIFYILVILEERIETSINLICGLEILLQFKSLKMRKHATRS